MASRFEHTTIFKQQIKDLITVATTTTTTTTNTTTITLRPIVKQNILHHPTGRDFQIFSDLFLTTQHVVATLNIVDITIDEYIGRAIKKMLLTKRITNLSIQHSEDHQGMSYLENIDAGIAGGNVEHLAIKYIYTAPHTNIVSSLPSLQTITTLKSLDLSHNELPDNDLTVSLLKNLLNHGLEALILQNVFIEDFIHPLEDILITNTSLKTFNIANNYFSVGGREALSRILMHNTTISNLNIGGMSLIYEDISRILKNNSSIKNLNLSTGWITTNALLNIRHIINTHKKLTILNINHGMLNDTSADIIIQMIDDNILESLDISFNLFKYSIVNIGQALGRNTSIKNLSIRGSFGLLDNHQLNVDHHQFQNIIHLFLEELAKNKVLEHLDLSTKHIDDECYMLAHLIENHPRLRSLTCVSVGLKDESVSAIIDALKCNSSLVELDVEYNSIFKNNKNSIVELLDRNKLNMLLKDISLLDVIL